jgi:hypothetical protein
MSATVESIVVVMFSDENDREQEGSLSFVCCLLPFPRESRFECYQTSTPEGVASKSTCSYVTVLYSSD